MTKSRSSLSESSASFVLAVVFEKATKNNIFALIAGILLRLSNETIGEVVNDLFAPFGISFPFSNSILLFRSLNLKFRFR
jgi:hypothetical protein